MVPPKGSTAFGLSNTPLGVQRCRFELDGDTATLQVDLCGLHSATGKSEVCAGT